MRLTLCTLFNMNYHFLNTYYYCVHFSNYIVLFLSLLCARTRVHAHPKVWHATRERERECVACARVCVCVFLLECSSTILMTCNKADNDTKAASLVPQRGTESEQGEQKTCRTLILKSPRSNWIGARAGVFIPGKTLHARYKDKLARASVIHEYWIQIYVILKWTTCLVSCLILHEFWHLITMTTVRQLMFPSMKRVHVRLFGH